ncbi:MAG TPA: O-antigen ligase family protein [Acidobacteriaceae bacterium]|jgi:O-antigen ligase
MSAVLAERLAVAERNRASNEFESQSFRVRLIKIVSAVLLGVCFWFSVPYYLPLKMDPDPKKAAANEAEAYEGNFSRQLAMPVIALAAAYLLWRLPKRGRFGSRLMPIAIMYVGWALLSASWSTDPSITIKRLVVFSINCFFAYTVARIFTVVEMSLFGFAQTGIVGLMSLYVDLFHEHNFAPFDPDYRFNGVMTANYQAMNLVVCMVCALTLLQRRPHWIKWIAPTIALGLGLVYLTRSRLGAVLGLIMLTIIGLRIAKKQLQPHARAMLVVASLTIVVPGLIYAVGRNGEQAAQSAFMMGRTDTENTSNLSNRAPLWAELMDSVRDRPIIGYGYEAFWTPARVERISADQGWMVPHAHDTYLDQTLSLGVVGMLLYVGMLLGGAITAWRRHRRNPSETSLYPAILLTWLALTGVAESVPLDPYLPTLLAYTCIVKMCMIEGSEGEADNLYGDELIHGLPRVPVAAAIAPPQPDKPVKPMKPEEPRRLPARSTAFGR